MQVIDVMNQKVIIYKTDNGVAIMYPVLDCGLSIEQIADKDVPAGAPYKIIDASELPSDYTFRNAWEYQP